MAQINKSLTHPTCVFGDLYNIKRKIGEGTFGVVYVAECKKTNMKVALKFERRQGTKKLKIDLENDIYLKLTGAYSIGFPQIIKSYNWEHAGVLVMELLGENVDERLHRLRNRYSTNSPELIETVIYIAIKSLSLIEEVHNIGYLHRDVKPNNLMFGLGAKCNVLYLIDFGLSKSYIKNRKHVSMTSSNSLVGTVRYASVNVHAGISPSRRDDLESLAYSLIYLLKGILPWKGIKKETSEERNDAIMFSKKETIQNLCQGLPDCFNAYLMYVLLLEHDEMPNYEEYRRTFEIYCKINNLTPQVHN